MGNNELTIKLGKKLKEVYDNNDFILAVLVEVTNPEEQQKILDFIETGEDVTSETILVLAMDLADVRE